MTSGDYVKLSLINQILSHHGQANNKVDLYKTGTSCMTKYTKTIMSYPKGMNMTSYKHKKQTVYRDTTTPTILIATD